MKDGTAHEWTRIVHQELDELLDLLRQYEDAKDESDKRGWSRLCLIQAADFAAHVCGDNIVADAYGSAPDLEDRSAVLRTLALRLDVATHLFGRYDRTNDSASLAVVAAEARAVAGGDVPQLFAKLSEYKVGVRLAHAKLTALEWDAYLEGRGVAPHERHGKIAVAYGLDWDSIRKWRESTRFALGAEHVQLMIRFAARHAEHKFKWLRMRADDDWEQALEAAGLEYRRILKENLGKT